MRLNFPATARNRDAILTVLQKLLPAQGTVLELASGSGEHVCHFAQALPALTWQPSDPDPGHRASIGAWTGGLQNVLAPVDLDARAETWPDLAADAVLCINMIHIAPWSACQGVMSGAGLLLRAGGLLVLYGPFRVSGKPTAPSNETFDISLRTRDPEWGVRDLEAVQAEAAKRGFALAEVIDMPANNLSVVFRKS